MLLRVDVSPLAGSQYNRCQKVYSSLASDTDEITNMDLHARFVVGMKMYTAAVEHVSSSCLEPMGPIIIAEWLAYSS